MLKMTIERSQMQKGRPVEVRFKHQGALLGTVHMPSDVWMKFNKLVQKGLEKQKLEGPEANENGLDVKIVGFIPEVGTAAKMSLEASKLETPKLLGGISNIVREEEDPDIAAAEAAAAEGKRLETLTKSLVQDGEGN